ncbi:carbamate kinase [Candidatus Woesearchaeota archaeon]|nr:carbamate kinase [Candidatus Woesearchaeota archaeon]
MKIAVVALGGNALSSSGEVSYNNLHKTIQHTCKLLVTLVKKKYGVVIVFGSGPQVGALLIQNQLAKHSVAPMPLDVLDAEVQGELGYLIEQSLQNELQKAKIRKPVISVLTQVIVSKKDPAFKHPSKPVGPFLTKTEADRLQKQGYTVKEDAGRGYRKVIPSPQPVKIDEVSIIRDLVKKAVVIAAGGGGIPVYEDKRQLKGIEAVIDKDRAASLLASSIKADELIMLTSVPYVYLNYGRKNQQPLKQLTRKEAEHYLREGHFLEGSMKPKIESSIYFLKHGGKKVIITSPNKVKEALLGKEGTVIRN